MTMAPTQYRPFLPQAFMPAGTYPLASPLAGAILGAAMPTSPAFRFAALPALPGHPFPGLAPWPTYAFPTPAALPANPWTWPPQAPSPGMNALRQAGTAPAPWSKEQKLLIGTGAGGLGGFGVAMIFQALHGASSHLPVLPIVLQVGQLLLGGAAVGAAGGAMWGAGMGGKQTVKGPGFTWIAEQPA